MRVSERERERERLEVRGFTSFKARNKRALHLTVSILTREMAFSDFRKLLKFWGLGRFKKL